MGNALALAVMNLKGGVGKTTLALILAHISLVKKKNTLCIDLDPQKNFSYGIEKIKNDPNFKDIIRLKDYIDEKDYDFPSDITIIDCPPALNEKVEEAMNLADIMLIPVRPDHFSLQNLEKIYEASEKYGKSESQLALVKIGFDNSFTSKEIDTEIYNAQYPVAGELQLDKRIHRNITEEGRIWNIGLPAVARMPYMYLYNKIEIAYKRMTEENNFKGAWLDELDE